MITEIQMQGYDFESIAKQIEALGMLAFSALDPWLIKETGDPRAQRVYVAGIGFAINSLSEPIAKQARAIAKNGKRTEQ